MTKITGILLAAGNSTRFGENNKLLQPLPDGTPIAVASARNLIGAVDHGIAVVRPEDHDLSALLSKEGFKTIPSPKSVFGMGESITSGVHASSESDGWLICLADMPFIHSEISHEIVRRLVEGAPIVRPTYQNRPGHPVGFSSAFRAELTKLKADEGAKRVIEKYASQVCQVPVSSPAICRDIDTPQDLKNVGT